MWEIFVFFLYNELKTEAYGLENVILLDKSPY